MRALRAAPLLPVAALVVVSCQSYVAPPEPSIKALNNGVLADPGAPLVVVFSKPIDPTSLAVKVIKFDPNAQGQLPDETGDASVSLDPLFSHDPATGDHGGKGMLDATATVYTIKPLARLPVGPKLAVLVEPGLTDVARDPSATTGVRRRLLFSYAFSCAAASAKILPSGPYFFLLDVQQPIGTQVRVFADVEIDPATGKFVGQFTDASRITDPNRCSPACTGGDVCQTLPGPPACVVPSTRAGTPTEWPDFYANATPPVGFSFTVNGCVSDQPDGTATLATQPADMVVQQPAVSVNGLVVVASFAKDASGNLSATGDVSGDDIVFGSAHLGAGSGTVEAMAITSGMAPNLPKPPPTSGDQ